MADESYILRYRRLAVVMVLIIVGIVVAGAVAGVIIGRLTDELRLSRNAVNGLTDEQRRLTDQLSAASDEVGSLRNQLAAERELASEIKFISRTAQEVLGRDASTIQRALAIVRDCKTIAQGLATWCNRWDSSGVANGMGDQ